MAIMNTIIVITYRYLDITTVAIRTNALGRSTSLFTMYCCAGYDTETAGAYHNKATARTNKNKLICIL